MKEIKNYGTGREWVNAFIEATGKFEMEEPPFGWTVPFSPEEVAVCLKEYIEAAKNT